MYMVNLEHPASSSARRTKDPAPPTCRSLCHPRVSWDFDESFLLQPRSENPRDTPTDLPWWAAGSGVAGWAVEGKQQPCYSRRWLSIEVVLHKASCSPACELLVLYNGSGQKAHTEHGGRGHARVLETHMQHAASVYKQTHAVTDFLRTWASVSQAGLWARQQNTS